MKARPQAWWVPLLFGIAACSGSGGGPPPALRIAGSLPPAGAADVAVDSPIVLTLNRALDPQTVDGALQVQGFASGLLAGHTEYDAGAQTLHFEATDGLSAGDAYEVRLANTVRTSDGMAIAPGLAIAFTTVAPTEPDWTAGAPIDGTLDARRFVARGDRFGVLCVFVQPDALGQQTLRWTRWTAAGGWSVPDAVPTAPLRADAAMLQFDSSDAGQSVLLADTRTGVRSAAFAPAGGWSPDQDAGLVPATASLRVDSLGTARAAWIGAEPPAGSPRHLWFAVRPWNGDWQAPAPVQEYAPGEVPALESFDALPSGQLGCLVRRPAANGRATFESVDIDPVTLATTAYPIDDHSFSDLASANFGSDGHRLAILGDTTPGSPTVLASWFTPGAGAGAGWSAATPLGIARGAPGSVVRTFLLPDGTALLVHWESGLFIYRSSRLTAMVRSTRSGWRPPVLLTEDGLGLPLDAVVDGVGLQLVSYGTLDEGLIARQWLPAERAWSPPRTLTLNIAGQVQVMRSGDRAHAIWITTGLDGSLMAAHRQ